MCTHFICSKCKKEVSEIILCSTAEAMGRIPCHVKYPDHPSFALKIPKIICDDCAKK